MDNRLTFDKDEIAGLTGHHLCVQIIDGVTYTWESKDGESWTCNGEPVSIPMDVGRGYSLVRISTETI